jgi:hypothetical protein
VTYEYGGGKFGLGRSVIAREEGNFPANIPETWGSLSKLAQIVYEVSRQPNPGEKTIPLKRRYYVSDADRTKDSAARSAGSGSSVAQRAQCM